MLGGRVTEQVILPLFVFAKIVGAISLFSVRVRIYIER